MKILKIILSLLLAAWPLSASQVVINSFAFGSAPSGPNCVEFNGTTGKINGFTVTTSSSWSLSFWFKPIASSDTYACILTQGTTTGLYYRGDSRKLDLYLGGDQLSTTALTEGNWYHVVLSVNGGSGTYYINGVSDGSFNGGTPAFNTMGDDPSTETFKGQMSEVCVYSIALNGTQAANLAAKTTTPATIGSRLAHWKLDELANGVTWTSETFADNSGNGKTGTGNSGLTGRTATY